MAEVNFKSARAGHTVFAYDYGGSVKGACVKFEYRGYEVSLASDGEDTRVFRDLTEEVFTIDGTTGASVKKAFAIIDILTEED